ncbi:MAG: beta-lactamase family protein [Bryobacteraceae bacterium]|nr:beta-lactamase family protein [Bryobacteraceae bacterium]
MRASFLLFVLPLFAAEPPRFMDSARLTKLKAALPSIEQLFARAHEQIGAPGSAWGVIIDGELVLAKAYGVRDVKSQDAALPTTAFRIASMTKSFTAAAILKLRDEGKLSLEDPIEKYLPEFKNYGYPTTDSAPIRVRQLLSHGAGFPEDNPWGDRQLAIPDATLKEWVKAGIPFSTTPDTAFEYSNYGFALAGQVIQVASGIPYREYIESRLLKPLGMTASSLEPSAIPAAVRANGYGRRDDGFFEIPSLAHGSFGAMGGLVTTVPDLAKWVAFQLSAFPARDGEEAGPVRRSSLREMQRLQRQSSFTVDRARAVTSGYGYGLGVSTDCRFAHLIGHGGGLPGFGSYMMWLPEYGVGMVAMTNLTYQGPARVLSDAFDLLRKSGGLEPRQLPAAPELTGMRDSISKLLSKWDADLLRNIAADNFLLDGDLASRQAQVNSARDRVGKCGAPGPVQPENLLRGNFRMQCEQGDVNVTFTLAPTKPVTLQMWDFAVIGAPSTAMRTAAQEYVRQPREGLGMCRVGNALSGDGQRESRFQLNCDTGTAALAVALRSDGVMDSAKLQRAPGASCAPITQGL